MPYHLVMLLPRPSCSSCAVLDCIDLIPRIIVVVVDFIELYFSHYCFISLHFSFIFHRLLGLLGQTAAMAPAFDSSLRPRTGLVELRMCMWACLSVLVRQLHGMLWCERAVAVAAAALAPSRRKSCLLMLQTCRLRLLCWGGAGWLIPCLDFLCKVPVRCLELQLNGNLINEIFMTKTISTCL